MIAIYHPNNVSKGFAASFQNSNKNDCVFAQLIRQSSWGDSPTTGSFKASREDASANVVVKLNNLEIAAVLDCIERGREYKSFHDSETPKSVSFSPWFPKAMGDEVPKQKGFSFSISVSSKENTEYKNSLYIGFSFAEARLIREY